MCFGILELHLHGGILSNRALLFFVFLLRNYNVTWFLTNRCMKMSRDFCDLSCSEEVVRHGFTVIVDMRGSKWDSIKPLLKILQESFPSCIHVALIIKPDNFWQKQRTNFGSSKFEFEVGGYTWLFKKCTTTSLDWPGFSKLYIWTLYYY